MSPLFVVSRRKRPGVALIYALIAMTLFAAICVLGADWGRVQMSRTELRNAADAAARYAVTGVASGTHLSKATYVATNMTADGQPIAFAAGDVEPGRWDKSTLTFTPGTVSPNAVRVTTRQSVPTLFGRWIGIGTATLSASAVVTQSVQGYGIVGLNSVSMSGNATASYASSGLSVGGQGNIASNGNITLGGSTTVRGNTYVGPGKSVIGGTVQGTMNTLTAPLAYPPGDAGPYGPSNNNNAAIPSWASPSGSGLKLENTQTIVLPGGNYYLNTFEMNGGSQLTFTGPATIYCYGSFIMSGKTETSSSVPGNLKLVMVPNPWNGSPPGGVTVGSTSAFHGSVYAPQSNVSITGTGDIYGSVLGLTVTMSGSGSVWYDTALETDGGRLVLVQ